jgi:hypothetical protein
MCYTIERKRVGNNDSSDQSHDTEAVHNRRDVTAHTLVRLDDHDDDPTQG